MTRAPVLVLALVGGLLGLVAGPAPARAGDFDTRERAREELSTRYGLSVDVGAGLSRYVDDALDAAVDHTIVGLARLVVGTRYPLAAEMTVRGGHAGVDSDVLGTVDLGIVGVESSLRVHLLSGPHFQPFVSAGVGWQFYFETDNPALRNPVRDNTLVFPLSVGLMARVSRILIEVRGTYRATFFDNLPTRLETDSDPNAGLRSGELTVTLGYEF